MKNKQKIMTLCVFVVTIGLISVLLLSNMAPGMGATAQDTSPSNDKSVDTSNVEEAGLPTMILYPAEGSTLIPIGGDPSNGFIPDVLIGIIPDS